VELQSLKGVCYVTIVAGLIYWLSLRAYQTLERASQQETEATLELVHRLAMAVEVRDGSLGQHMDRMGRFVRAVASSYGLPDQKAEILSRAAMLHDVGKIGVPDEILCKPARLTPDEQKLMRKHVEIGVSILRDAKHPLLKIGVTVVQTHHESWDGTGYPNGLCGEQIPIEGRIVAVCDVFEALLSERPYKDAWSVEDAIAEIRSLEGTRFDPAVVRAFENALPKLRQIAEARSTSGN